VATALAVGSGGCAFGSATPEIIYTTLPATPTPLTTAAPTIVATVTAEVTAEATPTPTPTPGPTATPVPTPTPIPVASTGAWAMTGSMSQKRWFHTATLLASGKVLIAGGGPSAVAELYNPVNGTFTPTGAMKVNRSHHTATLLGDGRVLITGGEDMSANVLASAEIYNPVTGTFVLTGSLLFPRQFHTATLLPNGTVLVTGGKNGAGAYLKAAETYSPVSDHFSSTAAMAFARANHTATALPDGTVLVAGGSVSGGVTVTAELYSGTTNHWTTTGSLKQSRAGAAATLLLAGRVLISGGYAYCPGYDPVPSGMACIDVALTTAEIYNPSTHAFAKTGSMGTARGAATLTLASVLLTDGRVMVPGGGLHSGATLVSAEAFRPLTGKFSAVAPMHFCRVGHTVTMLPNGKVLVTGGYDGNAGTTLLSAEVFTL
jgi:hypothetical protein